MQKRIKKFADITPHRSILTKISRTAYTVQDALAEFIDNAIDAKNENKPVHVSVIITPKSITISDDARGMTEQEAIQAIRLGFSQKHDQLGEFGIGLKTATAFLGNAFTLTTKQRGSAEEITIAFDQQTWLESGDWFAFPYFMSNAKSTVASGTTITITQLAHAPSPDMIKEITAEFSRRFGPFIKNNQLVLVCNDVTCLPEDYAPLYDKRNTFELEFAGGSIYGWWGYQLEQPNKSRYGFHTFHHDRLITTFDKIGLSPNQRIKQIIGELHIAGIPVTHNKNSWLKTSASYQSLESALRRFIKPHEQKLKRILTGFPVSSGIITGTARVVNMYMTGNEEAELRRIKHGDIIVTGMTRPNFILGIRRAAGIVTDLGGNLCHAAIMAREFNIPAVVGTQRATTTIQDGQRIIVDATEGSVYEDQ